MSLRHGFSLDVVVDDDRVTLVLRGELDIACAPEVYESVVRHAVGGRTIVVDLVELEFIDSTGVRALMVAWQEARAAGSALRFERPSDRVADTLELCGVLRLLPLEPHLT